MKYNHQIADGFCRKVCQPEVKFCNFAIER
jgi:hypothetical protein